MKHDLYEVKARHEPSTLLKCQCCGAPLEQDGHCSYCGARYDLRKDRDNLSEPVFIQLEHPKVQTLSAACRVPKEAVFVMDEHSLGEYTIRQLRDRLADAVGAAMKVRFEEDPINNSYVARATVRIVPPDATF